MMQAGCRADREVQEASMMNSSVLSLIALLLAALLVKTAVVPAHARSDTVADVSGPQWVDQTVYRPNCSRVEYDQRCIFDACTSDCGRR
ncbi:MAG TPA: hypothetical protein VFU97_21490 [Xanthobacteraceae bacterium]|jgi:hypothetical protein|nr:hypothetical protein [Xanthobacteraceae bacterium]